MEKEWVDFQVVKAAVDIQMVLDHYAAGGLKKIGGELRGPCPIHRGSAKSKHFSVNLNKNAFKCFFAQCGARGNVLDFVAAMEKCSVRDAAVKLKDWFRVGESQLASSTKTADAQQAEVKRGIYKDDSGALFEVITGAASAEDFEPLVVYRELFGEYRFWVAPVRGFLQICESQHVSFTLIKAL